MHESIICQVLLLLLLGCRSSAIASICGDFWLMNMSFCWRENCFCACLLEPPSSFFLFFCLLFSSSFFFFINYHLHLSMLVSSPESSFSILLVFFVTFGIQLAATSYFHNESWRFLKFVTCRLLLFFLFLPSPPPHHHHHHKFFITLSSHNSTTTTTTSSTLILHQQPLINSATSSSRSS